MLGAYRYILALAVACSHLWAGSIWWLGIYAVFGFYVISGYLMTLIIKEVYTDKIGAIRYGINRLLRIFPIYWVCLVIGLIVLLCVNKTEPQNTDMFFFNLSLSWPETFLEWFKNLTLIGPQDSNLTISQGWSLSIELIFYALMLVLCRRFWIVLVWLGISLAIVYYHQANEFEFSKRYISVSGASLAFASGSMIYYIRQKCKLPNLISVFFIGLFLYHFIFANGIWGFQSVTSTWPGILLVHHYGLPVHTVLAALILWAILDLEDQTSKDSSVIKRGNQLGKIAYAIFLCHWIVAYILHFSGINYTDKAIFFPLAIIGTNLFAVLLYRVVEYPLDKTFRDRIRGRKAQI